MTYDALKAQIQSALDADDMGAIKRLFPGTPPVGGAHTNDSGDNSPPPNKPPVNLS